MFRPRLMSASAALIVACCVGVAAAAPPDDVEQVTTTLPTLNPGQTAWVSTLWRGAPTDATAFELTADPPKGITVSYPENTGGYSSLYKQSTLLADDTDYAAFKVQVGDDVVGERTIKLRITYRLTSEDNCGGNGNGNNGNGNGNCGGNGSNGRGNGHGNQRTSTAPTTAAPTTTIAPTTTAPTTTAPTTTAPTMTAPTTTTATTTAPTTTNPTATAPTTTAPANPKKKGGNDGTSTTATAAAILISATAAPGGGNKNNGGGNDNGNNGGGNGQGNQGNGNGGDREVTRNLKVTLPVVAFVGPTLEQVTTSVGPIKAGTAAWVDVSYKANKPGVTNAKLTVKPPTGAQIIYPNEGTSTGFAEDTTLSVGETDSASFKVDTGTLQRGNHTLRLDLAYGTGQHLPGTVTLAVS